MPVRMYLPTTKCVCTYLLQSVYVLTCYKVGMYLPAAKCICTYLLQSAYVLTCCKVNTYAQVSTHVGYNHVHSSFGLLGITQ